MILALFAFTIFAFLALGSGAFLACVLLPPTRRYALSAALWFAVWGPCSVVFMVVAGMGLVTGALVMKQGNMHWPDAPKLLAAIGWGYTVIGALITTAVSTCAARLHQFLIHRLTFALFRLYATAISAGIGSVFGWLLSWWMMARGIDHLGFWWILSMLILTAGFGAVGYKIARKLRGDAPIKLTWITPEEFAGFGER